MYWVMSKLSAGCCMHFTTNIMSSNSSQYIKGNNLSMHGKSISYPSFDLTVVVYIWWPYAGFFPGELCLVVGSDATLENSM